MEYTGDSSNEALFLTIHETDSCPVSHVIIA